MTLLTNGDNFPQLAIKTIEQMVRIPAVFGNFYGVVLIYRGAWCPLCREQLDDYAAAKNGFDELGIKVVAFSVDEEAVTRDLVNKHRLPFAVGYGANATDIAAATGAFTNAEPHYVQPTNYILAPNGTISSALYSSNAVGRLSATEAKRFVAYTQSKAKTA